MTITPTHPRSRRFVADASSGGTAGRTRAPKATATRPPTHRGPGRIDLSRLPVPVDGSIRVTAWADPYLADCGHDARSSYVELFWLGILGPSSTMLLRRLATGLQHAPDGYHLPVVDTARSLGLAPPTTRNSPFVRALHRCVLYRVVRFVDDDLQVRRRLPTLHTAQLQRLPESLRAAHEHLMADHRAVSITGRGGASRGATRE